MAETIDPPFHSAAFYYQSCDSTITEIQPYLLTRMAEGTVFIADYQKKGVGQIGSMWKSENKKNILSTFVIYPPALAVDDVFLLNIITALAIYKVVAGQLNQGTTIKWPNDIYYGDKKLAGILITTHVGQQQEAHRNIKTAIISIGLNVNQLIFNDRCATSLALVFGKQLDRSLLLDRILRELGIYYAVLQSHRRDLLWADYLDKLYRKNGWYWFQTIDGPMQGQIVTVNQLGQLVIASIYGKQYSYHAKEIVFL